MFHVSPGETGQRQQVDRWITETEHSKRTCGPFTYLLLRVRFSPSSPSYSLVLLRRCFFWGVQKENSQNTIFNVDSVSLCQMVGNNKLSLFPDELPTSPEEGCKRMKSNGSRRWPIGVNKRQVLGKSARSYLSKWALPSNKDFLLCWRVLEQKLMTPTC